MTWNVQSQECFIKEQHICATLKFVCDIDPRAQSYKDLTASILRYVMFQAFWLATYSKFSTNQNAEIYAVKSS